MSALRTPLRELLRDPVDPRRVRLVWERVHARRSGRARWLRAAAPAFALAIIVLCGAGLIVRSWQARPGAMVYAERPLRWMGGAALCAVETRGPDPSRLLQLSDGTRITLDRSTRLRPRTVTASTTELALEQGAARFEVAPQHGRHFVVQAGEIEVSVVGTAFSVSRLADQTRVAVEHGRVRVRSMRGEIMLGAGDVWQSPPPVPVQQAAGNSQAQAMEQQAPNPAPLASTHSDPAPAGLVGATQAPSVGFARSLHDAPDAAALFQLSDAARAAGQPGDAARALEQLLQRFARDDRAPLAAFTLARLQLDGLSRPRVAAHSLQRALALGLPQALQEDALALLVRAYSAAGDHDNATRAAQDYRSQYPHGRFEGAVQGWAPAP